MPTHFLERYKHELLGLLGCGITDQSRALGLRE